MMLVAIVASIFMSLLVIAFHYHCLRGITRLSKLVETDFWRNFISVSCIFALHCVEIAWYAFDLFLAYEVLDIPGFDAEFAATTSDYLHLAGSSFTTLGAFTSQPIGGIAIMLDFTSLTGFTMLTWSATYYYNIFSGSHADG